MALTRSERKTLGRAKAGKCYAHNLPITPSVWFDGGTCSLGCKSLNTVREYHARVLTEMRRG